MNNSTLLDVIKDFRRAADQALKQEHERYIVKSEQASQIIAAAKKWVDESKVGSDLCFLFEEACKWPSGWGEGPAWWNHLSASRVEITTDSMDRTASFQTGDSHWKFQLIGEPYGTWARLAAHLNGWLVLEIGVKRPDAMRLWEVRDVQALIVGPWAVLLIEMAVQLRVGLQRRADIFEESCRRDQVSRIQLS